MTGVGSAGQDTGLEEDERGGTDGPKGAAGLVLGPGALHDAPVLAQGGHAGSAGKDEEVGQVPGRIAEGAVRAHGNAVLAGDFEAGTDGEGLQLEAGPAKEVDRSKGFHFLESVGEKEFRSGGHGGIP